MKKALYHRTDGQAPKELYVVSENGDGTVDLGEGENILVANCPTTTEGKAGHCTILGAAAPAKGEPGKDADPSDDQSKTDEKPDPKGGRKSGKDADKP